MVLLIGNYPADQQQSMLRFAEMMFRGLTSKGVPVELIRPRPVLGRIRLAGHFLGKWLGYVDKFVLFRRELRRRLAECDLVHICDHSNAIYGGWISNRPVVVTCHDLLAVRGALGEVPDTAASATGKYLQRWIVSGLRKASAIACDSSATMRDVVRIVGQRNGRPELSRIYLGNHYPYRRIAPGRVRELLATVKGLSPEHSFVLHVGSNLKMKNREGVLRIFARIKDQWQGQLVFAGLALTPALRSLGQKLGVLERVIEVQGPNNELLEALYNGALVLLYPSRFEGFGWPIIEAQACGCPVICARREPMSEVAGEAGLTTEAGDEEGMARALLSLTNPAERTRWSEKSLKNVRRFNAEEMVEQYIALYRSLGARV